MDENFRYKTINYSLHYVIRQIEDGRLDIEPSFKDRKLWSKRDKSRFIETLILGIPIPPIWCEESPSGEHSVIDGSERLRTLVEFARQEFELTGLKIRKEYNGFNFRQLPYHERLSLEDRYTFSFIIINFDTSPQLKCEFLRGLLRDNKNFYPQVARNFAYRRTYQVIQKLKYRTEKFIEFVNPESMWRYLPLTDSKIDEAFLVLLLILTLNDRYSYFYSFDKSTTVDDLLDWAMAFFEEDDFQAEQKSEALVYYLEQISSRSDQKMQIITSHRRPLRLSPGDGLTLIELYESFISIVSPNFSPPPSKKLISTRYFSHSALAKNLINYICG